MASFVQTILGLLNNPLVTIIIVVLIVFLTAVYLFWQRIQPKKRILYCSEEENQGQEFNVKRQTPAHLFTEKFKGDEYRFIRYRDAFTFTIGTQTITRWFGKKGTAYAKKLQTGEVGPFSLNRVMVAVWGQDVIDKLQDDIREKLVTSEVLITVRLEEGLTPEGYTDVSELYIKKEADQEMARIFAESASREFRREDYIRTLALIGSGVGLCLIGQAMGIIGSFG